jgi:hypothetical protein
VFVATECLQWRMYVNVCVCVCVRARACVRECVPACVRACVRRIECDCTHTLQVCIYWTAAYTACMYVHVSVCI